MTNSRIYYSVLQVPPQSWDIGSHTDQHEYHVIRSFDKTNTWHFYATMKSRADADDLARILNWQQDIMEKAYQQGKDPSEFLFLQKEDHVQAVMDIMSEYYDD